MKRAIRASSAQGCLLVVMALLCVVPVDQAFAWAVYNWSSHDVYVKVVSVEGGSTSCGAWDSGNGVHVPAASGGTYGSPDDAAPSWEDDDCNPSDKRNGTLTFYVVGANRDEDLSEQRGGFFCSAAGLAGGFLMVYDQERPGFSSAGSVKANTYCVSRFAEDKGYDSADCTGEDDVDHDGSGTCTEIVVDHSDYFAGGADPAWLEPMTPANRDVRFLATGDPQYWNARIDGGVNSGVNETADAVMHKLRDMKQSTKHIRGVIVAGDLVQLAKSSEFDEYEESLGSMDRFFFEGLGNHDIEDAVSDSRPGDIRDYVGRKARNTWPTKRNYDNGGAEIPHYSWDWHDIHFVQLNLFPGDDKPLGASNGAGLDPMDALQFLKDDLAANVGTTGRPVILTHHYGVDSFSVKWWTDAQREAYWNAIADYNVVAILTGHSHGYWFDDVSSGSSWEVDWAPSGSGYNARPDGRTELPTYITGAARGGGYSSYTDANNNTTCDDASNACFNGVFLDIEINHCNEMILTRKDDDGNAVDPEVVIDFDAPGDVNEACNTPPVADAGGPYSGDEGTPVNFDGSGSYDDDNDALEYRWDFHGDGIWDTSWSSSSTASYTWNDDYSGNVSLQVRDSSPFQAEDDDGTTVTVDNVAPVVGSVTGDTIDENGTATVSGTFSDASNEDSFTVTIDWKDGGSPVDYAYPAGSTGFSETHQYLDDNPTGTPSDVYTVDVTVTDDDTGSDSGSTSVTVNNEHPVIGSLAGDTKDENGIATVSGTFSDVGIADSFTVTIDWGEGSPVDYTYAAGSTSFSETHQYLDDNPTGTPSDFYTVDVTVTDDDTGSDSGSTSVTVNNVHPVIGSLTGDTIDENGIATVSGTFSDVGTGDSFTVTIDWKDGGIPVDYTYAAGSTSFSETHQYLDDNPSGTPSDVYTVEVTVTDDDTSSDSGSTSVTVNNVNPLASIDQLKDDLTGLTITFVNEDGVTVPGDIDVLLTSSTFWMTGSYGDTGTQDSHSASVDWDDATVEAVSITTPGATDAVDHAYASDAVPGAYTIALTVTDDDTGDDVPTAEIEVADAAAALANSLEDLQDLIDGGGLNDAVVDRLEKAMSHLTGNLDGDLDGDGDGDAENGALDSLDRDELNAAQVKIGAAVEELLAAVALDPSLDMEAYLVQLALTARSVAHSAIDRATALASKKSEERKIAGAVQWVADGDASLQLSNYLDAIMQYGKAVKEVQGIL